MHECSSRVLDRVLFSPIHISRLSPESILDCDHLGVVFLVVSSNVVVKNERALSLPVDFAWKKLCLNCAMVVKVPLFALKNIDALCFPECLRSKNIEVLGFLLGVEIYPIHNVGIRVHSPFFIFCVPWSSASGSLPNAHWHVYVFLYLMTQRTLEQGYLTVRADAFWNWIWECGARLKFEPSVLLWTVAFYVVCRMPPTSYLQRHGK